MCKLRETDKGIRARKGMGDMRNTYKIWSDSLLDVDLWEGMKTYEDNIKLIPKKYGGGAVLLSTSLTTGTNDGLLQIRCRTFGYHVMGRNGMFNPLRTKRICFI
jgi:hypothetical protein